jgi:hypothetical protein
VTKKRSNGYRAILNLIDALPEERRFFLSASARSATSDTQIKCGCVFGQLYPDHRDEARVIVNYSTFYERDPAFKKWIDAMGVSPNQLLMVQTVNDRYICEGPALTATEAAKVMQTEANARGRYLHVRKELLSLADAFDRGEEPSVSDLPPVVL